MAAVVQPCDAGVIGSTRAAAPCKPSSRPWVIAATALGSGMAFLDSTVVNVALPAIQADLGAYALVLATLMLVGGSLGDHYGRRRVFALGVALFAASSLWCALAAGPEQLILARAVQGLGGAMMVPGLLAIIGASHLSPPDPPFGGCRYPRSPDTKASSERSRAEASKGALR